MQLSQNKDCDNLLMPLRGGRVHGEIVRPGWLSVSENVTTWALYMYSAIRREQLLRCVSEDFHEPTRGLNGDSDLTERPCTALSLKYPLIEHSSSA